MAYALRAKVEKELERQEVAGVIEPIQYSEWAAPILVTAKADGGVWICGDFLLTMNRFTRLDTYPIPRVEDLYATIGGGENSQSLILAMITTKFALMMIQRIMLPSILAEGYTVTTNFFLG